MTSSFIPTLAETLESILLGYGDAPLVPLHELAALAWDVRAMDEAPFVDPRAIALAMGMRVSWWNSDVDLLVLRDRIFVRQSMTRPERGTGVLMGVAAVALRTLKPAFNNADVAVLGCDIAVPRRVVTRGTTSVLTKLQPHLTVGVLAAWGARCRGESMCREKRTGADSGA